MTKEEALTRREHLQAKLRRSVITTLDEFTRETGEEVRAISVDNEFATGEDGLPMRVGTSVFIEFFNQKLQRMKYA